MQEHPVPQQISSYQFRLVGDMTLKQFFQVAGGALVGIILYATHLPAIIKWPLIFVFFVFGAALAFLPLEDRPLDRWIAAFFRSIYSPTLFYWQQRATPQIVFQPETTAQQPVATPKVTVKSDKILDKLEDAETNFLSKVTTLFTAASPAANFTPSSSVSNFINAPAANIKNINEVATISVPVTSNIAVENKLPAPTRIVVEDRGPSIPITENNSATVPVFTRTQSPALENLQAVQFSPQAAPPTPPSQTNVIVGQVMDPESKIVEGAILEIKDSLGRPVRALKTNKAGHFMIVTPLANGNYELITEKDGFNFPALKFETKGAIIPPIAIRAKGRQVNAL